MKKKNQITAIILAAVVGTFAVFPLNITVVAQKVNSSTNNSVADTASGQANSYENYLKNYLEAANVNLPIELTSDDAVLKNGTMAAEYAGRSNVAILEKEAEISWNVGSLAPGFYAIKLVYASKMENNRKYELDVLINGSTPYAEAEKLNLSKIWYQAENAGETIRRNFRLDDNGNELVTAQEERQGWQERYLYDTDGMYSDSLQFYFSGNETLTLRFSTGNIALEKVTLCQKETPSTYQELAQQYTDNGYQYATRNADIVQAELPLQTSDTMLNPTSDHMSATTQPQDALQIKLNTIGQSNWQYTGQSITWEFTVPETGLYTVCMRVRQNFKRGVRVGRKILIDGKVPCKELERYLFDYSTQWYIEELGEEQPYTFYLEAGRHVLTMEAVTAFPDIIRRLKSAQYEMNTFYRKIKMLVGADPDPLRDYMLESAIPDFTVNLEQYIQDLEALQSILIQNGFEQGGESVTVEELTDQLKSFLEDPDDIPSRLSSFKDNISSLGNWLLNLTQQPLELDWIGIFAPSTEKVKANPGFFQNIGYGCKVFLASFIGDYSSIGGEQSSAALTVWVNSGRDQAQVIKRMVDNYFVDKYNVPVKLSLVQQGLIPATLSGRGPDVAILVSPTDTINLAVRDALVDLDRFQGEDGVASFQDTKSWFHKNSMLIYQYDGKTYGMPFEEQFYMMFYRTDILQELGLQPPATWTEMIQIISKLARNYLEIGIPSNMASSGQQAVNETVFQTLLYQKGGSYYKNGWESTGFSEPVAIAAFKQWTEFFTKYSQPVEYDFYTRFRSGEMPIGIAPYTTYNLLTGGAPELKGLWKMVPLPGTEQEDGTMDHSIIGAGNGIVMFKKAKDYDAAWKFIQWFAGADAQSNYSNEIENVLGPSARFDPANVEAFRTLAWDEETQTQLLNQWESMKMIPQTPAGYYISRNVTNAFRKVVYNGANPREALNSYNRDMNEEIVRKRKLLGLASDIHSEN